MYEYALIGICAFFASLVSFYSGFGLGTILMPILAFFFPLPVAIVFTAVVHLIHNLLRTSVLWKKIHWKIFLRFGLAAMAASIPGALLLKELSSFEPIKKYTIFTIPAELSVLNMAIGLLLILFATLEAFPHRTVQMKNLAAGGIISGFFGGLSGNQGAFRSVFLVHANLNKEAFIATSALISSLVDLVRLLIYLISFNSLLQTADKSFLGSAIGGALAGVVLGALLLPKVTLGLIKNLIIFLLYLLGSLLAAGII
jgi:hypothetical protein